MNPVKRTTRIIHSFLKAYGPTSLKKYFWDKEYSSEMWHFAYNTKDDCVYSHLEKHAKNGRILDLGCGSGNTSTELANTAYLSYIGIDVSEAALEKARTRSRECGRQDKNSFACSDFFSYEPKGKFDVILFRESMYHVPMGKIKAILDKYAKNLAEDGVFIVRLYSAGLDTPEEKRRPTAMLGIMEAEFDVIEKRQYSEAGRPTVLVFRPRRVAQPRLNAQTETEETTRQTA
jgi:2-polyprenyl-3-methyl-5-hydroxy-6-metoxy-1,4-benzoquinol methylase